MKSKVSQPWGIYTLYTFSSKAYDPLPGYIYYVYLTLDEKNKVEWGVRDKENAVEATEAA